MAASYALAADWLTAIAVNVRTVEWNAVGLQVTQVAEAGLEARGRVQIRFDSQFPTQEAALAASTKLAKNGPPATPVKGRGFQDPPPAGILPVVFWTIAFLLAVLFVAWWEFAYATPR